MKYTLIYDPTAPFDGVRPSDADLAQLSEQFNLMSFTGALPAETAVLVNLHGKYFPKGLWKELSDGLKRGMGYLSFSAEAPLSRPVYRSGGEWYAERPQTAYHKRLMIRTAFPLSGPGRSSSAATRIFRYWTTACRPLSSPILRA